MNDVHHEEEILLKFEEPAPCQRCDGVTVLLARYPHSWKNNRGEDVAGFKEELLCPACHHGEPAATELLALFAVDDQVSLENMEAFGGLVAAWVESVRQRTVDTELLGEEHVRWQRGEL